MSKLFLGIDIGCGGAKACIIDDSGRVVGYGFREHTITVSHGTWSETDPDEYWGNIAAIVKGIIADKGLEPGRVRAVSVSSAVPATVMLDRGGRVVNKAYNFLDTRAMGVAERLRERLDEEQSFRLCGFEIGGSQFNVLGMLWEKENRPADYKRIWKVLTPDAYVTYRLTGKAVVNYSAGNFYGAIFDVHNKRFHQPMLDELGIDRDLLPDVFPCEQVIGEITREAADITGLAAGTPVIAGTVDAFAGWLAGGAIEEGDTQINLGTAAVLGVVTGKPNFVRHMWNCVYPVHSENNYVIFGSTVTGGYVMRHLRNNFSNYEKLLESSGGYDAYTLMNVDAESTPPGAGLMITLPHFMGAHTPAFNPDARGVVFGWSMNHRKGHLIRSMMEGVAMSAYTQYRTLMEAGIPTRGPIVMNEGGAKSKLWRRIFTDVFNRPTVLLKNRTGAPYGNAILAGVATGHLPGYAVAREWAEYVDACEPDTKTNAMYMDIFRVYSSVYRHLRDDYAELAALRRKYGAV